MPNQKDEQFERFEQWARQHPKVQEIINKTNRRLDILNLAMQLIRVVMILGFVGAGFYADHYYNSFPIFTLFGCFAMVGVYFQKQELTLRDVYQQLAKKRRHPGVGAFYSGIRKSVKDLVGKQIASGSDHRKEMSMANQIPEKIISRNDADRVFGLKKDEWEKDCKNYFASGWTFRTAEHDTGKHVAGYDPSTGIGLSIQPLSRDEHSLPDMVIVGSHFPPGVLPPMTEETQKEMEAAAQQGLGETYRVRLIYRKLENLESSN